MRQFTFLINENLSNEAIANVRALSRESTIHFSHENFRINGGLGMWYVDAVLSS